MSPRLVSHRVEPSAERCDLPFSGPFYVTPAVVRFGECASPELGGRPFLYVLNFPSTLRVMKIDFNPQMDGRWILEKSLVDQISTSGGSFHDHRGTQATVCEWVTASISVTA